MTSQEVRAWMRRSRAAQGLHQKLTKAERERVVNAIASPTVKRTRGAT